MPRVKEIADHAGVCHICGKMILVGDVIIRDTVKGIPLAAHVECDLKTGGQTED